MTSEALTNINLKDQVLEQQQSVLLRILKTKYSFFYDQLLSETKMPLIDWARDLCQDQLNDLATDGVHTENLDKYHSNTSASVDFDEISNAMNAHKEMLNTIESLFAEHTDN